MHQLGSSAFVPVSDVKEKEASASPHFDIVDEPADETKVIFAPAAIEVRNQQCQIQSIEEPPVAEVGCDHCGEECENLPPEDISPTPCDRETDCICEPARENEGDLCPDKRGLFGRGLLHYRKWWEMVESDFCVGGDLLSGIPIFADENTLRVAGEKYSYFIPLEKIDYIRTPDGYDPCDLAGGGR